MADKAIAGQAKLAEELKKMEYEPLLPVEKQLIGWSVGLGTALLVILYFVSALLLPERTLIQMQKLVPGGRDVSCRPFFRLHSQA